MDEAVNQDKLKQLQIDRSGKQTTTPSPKMPRKNGWRLWPWLLVLLTCALIYWFTRDAAVELPLARVSWVYPSQTLTLFNATGYVVPQTKADVASKATGRLEKLEVEEGMRVVKDQILARIENHDLVASMNQAQANIEVARAQLKVAEAELKESSLVLNRVQSLENKKFASRELLDNQIARHDKATAQINQGHANILAAEAAFRAAQVAVEYTLIRAPFDGIVLSKNADVGDVLAPFSPANKSKGAVVSMADMDTLAVEADVSESNLLQVNKGQPCEIQLDALPDTRLRGEVLRIVPTVDRAKATVMVKVAFLDKDARVLPDMSAKVAFLSRALSAQEQRPLLAVQAAALVEREGETRVFAVQAGRAKTLPIKVEGSVGDWRVIGPGLKPGDQVVLNPPENLGDGDKITPLEAK